MKGFDNYLYKVYEGIEDIEGLKQEYFDLTDEMYRLNRVKREIEDTLKKEGIRSIQLPNGGIVGI